MFKEQQEKRLRRGEKRLIKNQKGFEDVLSPDFYLIRSFDEDVVYIPSIRFWTPTTFPSFLRDKSFSFYVVRLQSAGFFSLKGAKIRSYGQSRPVRHHLEDNGGTQIYHK